MNIYAVSLRDMVDFEGMIFPLTALRPVLEHNEPVVYPEGDILGREAVLVRQDVTQERWDALYDLIRNGIGARPGIRERREFAVCASNVALSALAASEDLGKTQEYLLALACELVDGEES